MNQSRTESLVEAVVNTAVGFVVSYSAWPLIAWAVGMDYGHAQHFWVTVMYTVLSVARGYAIRRWFNGPFRRVTSLMAGWISQGAGR